MSNFTDKFGKVRLEYLFENDSINCKRHQQPRAILDKCPLPISYAQSAQHQVKLILGTNWMLDLASNFDSEMA